MTTWPFRSVLVANRGEIAVRVLRGCRELGLVGVAVYSDPDAGALHVREADRAVAIGGAAVAESYLDQAKLLAAAAEAGAGAVHPGYGLLSEHAGFARAVAEAGLVWVGPPPEAMAQMGDKLAARRAVLAAGVEPVPGTTDPVADPAEVVAFGEASGWPVAVKAAAGGQQLRTWAVAVAKACGYVGAGTVEFLWDPESGGAWFLEMNTRIQVEHPITEQVTGVDIVAAQLRVAAGEPLGLTQDEVVVRGHAVECRINAEDPARGFLPTPGTITALRWPGGPGLRVDAGYEAGDAVSPFYDDLLGKLVAWAPDRERAIARMRAALDELAVEGVATTAPALARVLGHDDFRAARHWTTWLEEAVDLGDLAPAPAPEADADFQVSVGGRSWPVRLHRHRPRAEDGGGERGGLVASPLAGTLAKVEVTAGQQVAKGELLAVVEAMKMETSLLAPFSGTVVGVRCAVGGPVSAGQVVVEVDAGGSP